MEYDDEKEQLDGEHGMNKLSAATWGVTLYRVSATLAGLVALLTLLNFTYNFSIGDPRIPVAASTVAVIIWLIGLFCRHVFDAPTKDQHQH
jgi:hypothetical protein